MRYKATFIAGVAVGFVAGARAGRGAYDALAGFAKQVADHPKVQQATNAAQAKATGLAKSAAAKAPDYAKSAAASAAKTAQAQVSQVPKYVSSARQAATSKLPGRLGGTTTASAQGDIAPDGSLVYPAGDGSPSVNGTGRAPEMP